MPKLFIIATPLSLLVSQQLVRQGRMQDAILWESWVEPNSEFLKVYDLCIIPSLWKKRLKPVGGFTGWDGMGLHLWRTGLRTWHRYQRIKRILRENDVDEVFVANYQEEGYRFLTVLLTHAGYKVSFYEEGSSHYVQLPYHINRGPVAWAKQWLLDGLYYLPLYHVRFAYWRNNPNRPTQGLPIHRRFSIVPGILREPFDRQLKCEPMLSDKLKGYLQKTVGGVHTGSKTLLLTEPMDNVMPQEQLHLYYDTIAEALAALKPDSQLFIKFHPREKESSRQHTLDMVRKMGTDFTVLSSEMGIPVEYFLMYLHFDEILIFNASTFFYNGYLFPKTEFKILLRPFLKRCQQGGAGEYTLNIVKGWIGTMSKLKEI